MIDWSNVDYSSAPRGYRELRNSAVRVDLPSLKFFRLSGADCLSWLQGQCTNDVSLINVRPWLDFCLTKPTGQILTLCRAWKHEAVAIIATELPSVILARAEETVIMEEVVIEALPDMECIQGPECASLDSQSALPSDWTGSGGLFVNKGVGANLAVLSEEAWILATLESGHPLKGADYNERTLPPDLGQAFDSQYVSYKKGCYTGQEVLMRIKSRGHTNKTWVALKSNESLVPRAKVMFDGREVGVVHRCAVSPVFGPIASATIKNEAAQSETEIVCESVVAKVTTHPLIKGRSS